jgi:tRNA (mo5U34)-methyltransferase
MEQREDLPAEKALELAQQFQERLRALKAGLEPPQFWYPYGNAVDNVYLLSQMLTGERRNLRTILGNGVIADIGAADGELAFFLETLGCRPTIVDYAPTNYNALQGAQRLREALGSKAEIIDTDLDNDPRFLGWYDLVLFLGALYHFKNPYGVLERLAKNSRYCLISTRIARRTPDRSIELAGHPVAYLVDPFETNNDPTNFWIFSEDGLRALVERTGWSILDYLTFGNTTDSDPASAQGDERAFCLLRSNVF